MPARLRSHQAESRAFQGSGSPSPRHGVRLRAGGSRGRTAAAGTAGLGAIFEPSGENTANPSSVP
jgi:hypothetical protein